MIMRKVIYVFFAIVLFASTLSAQVKEEPQYFPEKSEMQPSNYQLFPTKNIWTLLKLDTRNGLISQVHYSLNTETSSREEVVLNDIPLVNEEDQQVGRFTLYPTHNMYTFILLDRINGRSYQVQWSMKSEERFIVPIRMR